MSRHLRAAVLGAPISHSKSPLLHTAAYRHLGLDIDYQAIEVSARELPGFMDRVRAELDWVGLSVTMPLKAAMAELVDELSVEAAALGVVNTVTFDGPGHARLRGHNTDIAGIVHAVRQVRVDDVESAVILGGGGTALAAAAAAAQLGARNLEVVVRSPAKAAAVTTAAERLGMTSRVLGWDAAVNAVPDADLVISTLPPRAADPLAASLAEKTGHRPLLLDKVLLDAAYEPWPSSLAQYWQQHGGKIVPGLEMLLYQGVEQVRLFSGASFSDPAGVINAICDALGAPRRAGLPRSMAG